MHEKNKNNWQKNRNLHFMQEGLNGFMFLQQ